MELGTRQLFSNALGHAQSGFFIANTLRLAPTPVIDEHPPRTLPEPDLHTHDICTLSQSVKHTVDQFIKITILLHTKLTHPHVELRLTDENLASNAVARERARRTLQMVSQRADAQARI